MKKLGGLNAKLVVLLISLLGVAAVIFVALVVIPFVAQEQLPFEVLDEGPGGQGYEGWVPALVIVASQNDVQSPEPGIEFRPNVIEHLNAIDYSQFFAILVLHGRVGDAGYSVNVQQVGQFNGKVTVLAEFIRPPPGTLTIPVFTSPFQLIKVSKGSGLSGEVRFVLRSRNKGVLAETTVQMP